MGNKMKEVAIIFGASRGIGAAMAFKFAREGYAVVVSSKTEVEKENVRNTLRGGTIHSVVQLIKEKGGKAIPMKCDVRNEQDISRVFEETQKHLPDHKVTAVIYNSGAITWGPVHETPLKKYDLLHSINARGCYIAVQHWLRINNPSRFIVLSAPIYSRFFRGKVPYAMSKVAMTVLLQGLALEIPEDKVICGLWPATAIESAATEALAGIGRELMRSPDIMADAAWLMTRDRKREGLNGVAWIEEDYLRERWGIQEFSSYRCVRDKEPPRMLPKKFPSLRVEEEDEELFPIDTQSKL
ncbi:uncharacterized protein VTP21DRAFT_10223 [Calcarisporiella thermophila]|uniref:uncharacterized protein n=1 Tax=Calcarisporiella thermophila TaxID=911321 RepID=UPI0037447D50